jgi:uncharacterized lipoprotein YbaY/uncharacterized membrane protein
MSPAHAFSLVLGALSLLLAACAGPPPVGDDDLVVDEILATLSGVVTYPQRIALPPSAVVHVWIDDVSRADGPADTLAERSIPAGGRQVPIPFAIEYDPGEVELDHRYVVRAEILDGDGTVRWTTDAAPPVLTQGAPSEGVEVRVVPVATRPDATERSPMAPQEHARQSRVDFRAVGQEPGWHLEIREGERIRFVYAYGEQEAVTPAPEPTRSGDRTVYRAETEAHDLTVTIVDEPCVDTMSGEAFEASVTVELDGETYRGCGRSL